MTNTGMTDEVYCPPCKGQCKIQGGDIQKILWHTRLKQGMTRHELARSLGWTAANIRNVEEGDPHLSSIRRMAAALGVLYEVHFQPAVR